MNVAELMRTRPVFDAHADSLQLALDLGRDLGERGAGHLDLERGEAGGLGSLVFVCWCDPAHDDGAGGAFARTRDLLGEFHALVERHSGRVRFAGNGVLLEEAHRAGALAGIPGIEGGHSIEGSLERLEWFFERGVRVMTLVWNNHLPWIRSCRDGAGPDVPEGLSRFGRDVVRRMNELGMVVDLSHAGARSFYDSLECSTRPVIASHSGCQAIHEHPRNLDDDQLRALAANGGVVGVVFCVPFLDGDAGTEDQRLRETDAYRALQGANDTELYVRQAEFLQAHAAPLPIDRVCDHVCHAIEVAGIDHVGIGSDFDGIQRTPEGLEDASCYGALAVALQRRGLDATDIGRVLGGNMRRVFAEVTAEPARASTQRLLRLP